ncbi:hypothetical protein BGX26_012947 [Mortierella sp. AD094]|nr:hypothetical protein BGX26_012947 [Mortierella sp. AD094]
MSAGKYAIGTPGQWSATTFEEIKDFNILVLGERQSGKSTLIEAIKNYARHDILDPKIPSYTPTTNVTTTLITTALPRFSIFENADGQNDGSLPNQLNNDDIRQYLSLDDEEYDLQKPYLHIHTDQQTQNPHNFNFKLIDTPGLDFIKDGSKSISEEREPGVFVSKTLPAIVKQLGPTCAVHLVLLVVPDADNYDNSDVINFYRNVLPPFEFITVVAHRGIEGDKATPVSKAFQHRHKSPYGDNYADQSHFITDNLFIRNDPIRNCLARNDIRRVLELALLNEPVFMQPEKPSFIKDLDGFLEDRYSEVLKTIHDAVATAKDSSPFHTILQLTKIQCDEDAHKETVLSSSPLKLVFSRRFENTLDAPTANGLIEVEMESTEGRITHVDILQHNVEILQRDGGVNSHRLRLAFRWTSAFHGVFDIRIYVNAAATSHRSNDIPMNITEAIKNAVSNSKNPSNQHRLIMEFLERYRHFHIMHRLTSATVVHPDAFQILAVGDIDKTTPIDLFECVEKLETVYFNVTDTYNPKITSPEKTLSEIFFGDGDSERSIYPAVNRFRSHLVDRRARAPWLKIVYVESMPQDQSGDIQLPNLPILPIPEQLKKPDAEIQPFSPTVEETVEVGSVQSTSKETFTQKFRAQGSSEIISFKARKDFKTGHHVIMWEDIKMAFGNVELIRDGSNFVPFLLDENLERLEPKRISYYPGAVLEVIMAEDPPVAAKIPGTLLSSSPSTRIPSLFTGIPPPAPLYRGYLTTDSRRTTVLSRPDSVTTMDIGSQKDSDSTTIYSRQDSDNMTINSQYGDYDDPAGNDIVKYLTDMTPDKRQSMNLYLEQNTSFFVARMNGQETQAARIKNAMSENLDELKAEIARNYILQLKNYALQQSLQQSPLQLQDQLQPLQEDQLHPLQQDQLQMQQKKVDQLARIYGSIQAVLKQNYELHEYPIPHLFIVLPRAKQFTENPEELLSGRFQLFFLCECGKHSMRSGRDVPDRIHLAKHEGYDLEQPNKFFEKYGSHLLTMMRMVKYGFAVVQIPPTSTLSTEVLVDQMIEYLQKFIYGADADVDEFDFDKQEALDGADLKQLATYIKVPDGPLGNLYRLVTDEGHIKWVCIDHYRANNKEAATSYLRDIVENGSGSFEAETGKIKIRLPSSTPAKQFYGAMINARCTQELEITLDWDVVAKDFERLAYSVAKANVINLTLYGERFKLRTRDLFNLNRNKRFDPVIGIINNRRIQSLQLLGFDDFFTSISGPTVPLQAPQLQILHIDSPIDLENKTVKVSLIKIMDGVPNLRLLQLTSPKLHALYEFTMSKYGKKLGAMSATWDKECPVLTLEFLRGESTSAMNTVVNQRSYINSFRVMISTATDQMYWLSTLLSEHGWAIKELDIPLKFDDTFAQSLDTATSEKGSRLWKLALDTDLLSSKGVDSMIKVIDRSKMLENLGLTFYSLDDKAILRKLEYLLQHHADKLSELTLYVSSPHLWMPEFTSAFSDSVLFLNMSVFQLCCDGSLIPRTCIQWIVAMLSSLTKSSMQLRPTKPLSPDTPSSPFSSSSPYSSSSQAVPAQFQESTIDILQPRSSLRQFSLENAQLESEDWQTVIKAIDFSSILDLNFRSSITSFKHLEILVDCMPEGGVTGTTVPLRSLDIRNMELGKSSRASALKLIDALLKKVPGAEIKYENIREQSGKTTLIEAIKNYARQDNLDSTILSYTPTTDVTSTIITTTLPRFSIFESFDDQDDGSQPRLLVNDDIRRYLSLNDEKYEQQKPYLHIQVDQQTQNPYNFNFRLIDTPGLDFIKDGSKSISEERESGVFVSKTLPGIIKQLGPTCAVHLVLLVVPDADNYDNSDAVNFYRNILPAFDFITVVAHRETKGDKATPVSKAPQPRHQSRNGDSYADQLHFIIDNLFVRDDPIRSCLARNYIRCVLELTLLNEPVFMQPKKPSFIKDLDDFLEDRYSEALKTIHDAVATAKDSSPFHTILQLTKIQCDEDARKETILSSSPLKLVVSRRFENTWYAPSADSSIEVEMESTECAITHVDILQRSVEIVKQDGGIGEHRLRLVFRWTSAFHGVLDIRIYANASATSHRSNNIQKNIAEAVHDVAFNSKNPSNQHKLIMELLQRYRQFHVMHHLSSSPTVFPETIQILSICNIDRAKPIDLFQCVENLEKAYLGAADAYTPKLTPPDKTSTEMIVDGGNCEEAVFPTISRFQRHLLDRRALAPWSKIEYINPISPEEWYLEAASQGNDSAQYSLGLMYQNGYGVTQDYSKALEWYQKAADQGNSNAQYSVGVMYRNGCGITRDYLKALEWFQKAANQGDSSAQNNLGFMYRDGYGVVQDLSKALEWFQKAASQGNASAQNSLGFMYRVGYGVAQDYSKAREWYQKAAIQGDSNAQSNVGFMYQNAKSPEWLQKAASQRDSIAPDSLGGIMYQIGHGIPRDYSDALEWFQEAADQGNASAKRVIEAMYQDDHGSSGSSQPSGAVSRDQESK